MTELRPFTADELAGAHTCIELAFGSDPHPLDQAVELSLVDPALTLGAFADGQPVGTAGWFDLRMTLPGSSAAAAGVTWVSVAPTHRRQGVLSEMMERQFSDLRAADRPPPPS